MDTGKIALGVLAGLAAGAILGILFAPASGKDTRHKISEKSGDAFDSMKEKFSEFVDGIWKKYEDVKEDVSDFAEANNPNKKEAEKS
jgi:gas vesicle protein